MTRPTLRTSLCDMLGIEYPIVLAGMGGIEGGFSRPELVAAISEAGGLGVLGGAGNTPERIHEACEKVRALTKRPFGIDLLLPQITQPASDISEARPAAAGDEELAQPYQDFIRDAMDRFDLKEPPARPRAPHSENWAAGFGREKAINAIIEEKVAVFAAGLGSPGPYIEGLHAVGTKVIGLAGNVRTALRLKNDGCDIIVSQGHEAGGHTGRIGTFALAPQVLDAVSPTPVLVAGGVGSGRAIAAALAFGAVGVWVGTKFLATNESGALPEHKQRMVEATEEDTRVTRFFTGRTVRNLHNPLIEMWEDSRLPPVPMSRQNLVSGRLQDAARASNQPNLLVQLAGQIVGSIDEIRPARVVFDELIEETVYALRDLMQTRVTYSIPEAVPAMIPSSEQP
jgi:nitronate monooxygenase